MSNQRAYNALTISDLNTSKTESIGDIIINGEKITFDSSDFDVKNGGEWLYIDVFDDKKLKIQKNLIPYVHASREALLPLTNRFGDIVNNHIVYVVGRVVGRV